MNVHELKEALIAMIAAIVAIVGGAVGGFLWKSFEPDAGVLACVAYGTLCAIAAGMAFACLRNDLSKDPV